MNNNLFNEFNNSLDNIIQRLLSINFFNYIDHIYYINLEKRKDRKKHIENELNKIDPGLKNTTRFNAIVYNGNFKNTDKRNKGAIGCSLSHIEIAKIIKEKKYRNVLIIEDDFKLNISIQELNRLISYFFKEIKSYYFLLLGTHNLKYKEVNKELSYVKYTDCTTGYIINESILDDWIKTSTEKTNILIKTGKREGNVIDDVWDKYNKDGMRYTFDNNKRRIAYQIKSYSDIDLVDIKYLK